MTDGDFERLALDRVPLAEACLVALDQVLRPDDLEELYRAHRGRGYDRVLGFAPFVGLVRDCLLGRDGAARRALLGAAARGDLPVSAKAFYDKLGHLDPAVGAALVAHAHARLAALLPEGVAGRLASPLPACVRGFDVVGIDGKVVKHVPRRLRPLRLDGQSACRLLGGKALVAVDLHAGLPVAMHPDKDGEAGEGPLFAPLLARLTARAGGPAGGAGGGAGGGRRLLVVADRGFGMFEYAKAVRDAGGEFVLRRHGKATFVADPAAPAGHATDRYGRALTDQAGWLTRGKGQAERVACRLVTIPRDKGSVELLTSLADAAAYPADGVAEVYRHRWDCERLFQEVTGVFGLRHLIGTRPEAGLFQAAFCLVLYAVVAVVRHHVAAAGGREADAVSGAMLWRDVRDDLTAALRMVPVPRLAELTGRAGTAGAARARLGALLGACWRPAWAKANRRDPDPARAPKPRPVRLRQKKGHDSVHRVLDKSRRAAQ